MNTTHFFVELLVIGFGCLTWIGVLAVRFLGADIKLADPNLVSLTSLMPLLSVVYVLGIVTDRVADWIFDRWDQRALLRSFGDDRASYYEEPRVMVMEAPQLWAHLEYGRSRMRICRGSAINAVLFVVALDLTALFPQGARKLSLAHLISWNMLLLLFASLCVVCWRELNHTPYKLVATSHLRAGPKACWSDSNIALMHGISLFTYRGSEEWRNNLFERRKTPHRSNSSHQALRGLDSRFGETAGARDLNSESSSSRSPCHPRYRLH